jgi:hypothetical protein
MSNRASFSQERSGGSALGLLERARELARQSQPTSRGGIVETATPRGGDKGEKGEKPPSSSREHSLPTLPGPVLQSDDAEVAWGARAMRSQIRPGFPVPFLVAREDPIQDGACLSCSVPLRGCERYRCATCLEAAMLVLASLHGPTSVDGNNR